MWMATLATKLVSFVATGWFSENVLARELWRSQACRRYSVVYSRLTDHY